MRKTVDKIRHNWKAILSSVCILAIFSGFYFYINWIWDTQGQNATLSQISLFIAAIVAIVALWSIKITRDSLRLTRAVTRPFLTLEKAEYDPHMPEIILYVCNTGALPGDGVSVEIFFWRLIDDRLLIIGSISHPLPSIFPKEEKILASVINQDMLKYINSGEEARILVSIKYQSIEKECNTRRMLRWPTGKEARQHPLRLEVLEEGNYWN